MTRFLCWIGGCWVVVGVRAISSNVIRFSTGVALWRGRRIARIAPASGSLLHLVGAPLFRACGNPCCSSNAACDFAILLFLGERVVGFVILAVWFGHFQCVDGIGIEPILGRAAIEG